MDVRMGSRKIVFANAHSDTGSLNRMELSHFLSGRHSGRIRTGPTLLNAAASYAYSIAAHFSAVGERREEEMIFFT